MRVIKCTSIRDAYHKGVEYILREGVIREIHGTRVLQADEAALEIRIDNNDDWSDRCPLKRGASAQYVNEFLNPDKGDQTYTYGERLCNYQGFDQMTNARRAILQDRYTRQAVCSIWNPVIDGVNPEPPCLQHVQFYFDSKDRHTMKVLFRSNDWYQAVLNNLQGLKLVASENAIGVGTTPYRLILDVNCPHIYWYNIETCENLWHCKSFAH